MNMKKIAFEPLAFEQFSQWALEDKKIFQKNTKTS